MVDVPVACEEVVVVANGRLVAPAEPEELAAVAGGTDDDNDAVVVDRETAFPLGSSGPLEPQPVAQITSAAATAARLIATRRRPTDRPRPGTSK